MSTERNKLNELEARLASLTPAASGMHRDRTMYLAGYAAAEADAARERNDRASRVWLWPMSTAAMALIALSLGALLVHERQSRPVMADSQSPPSTPDGKSLDARDAEDRVSPGIGDRAPTVVAENGASHDGRLPSYVQIRQRVLDDGVDALTPDRNGGDGAAAELWTPRSHPPFTELLEG